MKILVATPSGRGLYSDGFVHSMLAMMTALNGTPGIHADWTTHTQALVGRSRNSLATNAMRAEYDIVWMIDDDMKWGLDAVEAVLDLLSVGAPIVAVAASKRSYPLNFPVRFIEGSEKIVHKKAIRIREVLTVGTGFMAIKVKALEEMAATGQVSAYTDYAGTETLRFFFEAEIVTNTGARQLMGEDETFVIRAREMGIKTIIPMDVTMGHEGMHVFTGKVADFDPWDKLKPA